MISFAELTALVEALLFVSERPVPAKELASFIDHASEDQVKEAISGLANRYAMAPSGLQVEEVAGGFRLSTRPELGDAVKEFFRIKNRQKLSRAALETCAIIAYKQPITNPEIQEIRGVSADGVLRTLLERRLIRIVGRKDTVGKPLLYGTTRLFLEHFGLATLDELPPVEEFGDVMGDGSSEHLVAALDRLPGGDAGAILPLQDETGGQEGDAGAGASPLEPPSTPTDGAGANGAGESS
ncbi:MAG: SMC-Scp complex subunit ScpB [Acidobacteria bacterium]|nr:SMC-Scp complex subunit ScpB [Acidobacteriota bacterium]